MQIPSYEGKGTQGTKTFYYLQEKKSIEIPLVMANEKGTERSESAAMRRCGAGLGHFGSAEINWNVGP